MPEEEDDGEVDLATYICDQCQLGNIFMMLHSACMDPDCTCKLHDDGLGGRPDDDYYQQRA